MRRLQLVILIFFVFSTTLYPQAVRFCVGTSHDFGVPPALGSVYNWEVQNNNIATIASGNGTEQIIIDLNNTGLFQLMVQEVDANGCIGYDSILVEVIPLPTPNIFALGPISFCEGDGVFLQVDSVYTSMAWINNGDTIGINPVVMVDTTGEYFIDVADTNGCVGRSPSIITLQHPNPDIDFSLEGVCANMPTAFFDESTIALDMISTRIWYFGDGNIAYGDTVENTYIEDGNYMLKLIVISDFDCVDSLSRIISIYNQPVADFSYSPYTISTLQPEMSFTNTSLNASPILWSFGDDSTSYLENPSHIYSDPGIYDVVLTVSDTNNCIDSISKQILMSYDFVFYMPNSFTPNNDGKNDVLKPEGMRMKKYQSYQFIVYDKWGGVVFETTDFQESWDGGETPDGSYSWIILIKDEMGKIRRETGSVSLIR